MQPLATNRNEEYKLAQRPFSLFDRRTLSALVLLSVAHCTSAAEEPLPPDQAFRFKASLKGTDTVVAEIIPAKKHYLYKNKVRFALKNASGVLIKEVKLPSGEMKNDPYFGLIEVYKSPVVAEILLERAPKAKAITLYASYQGCNEKLGVCYPPIEKSVEMKFPQ